MARSIQPNFPEISVQNSMDRFRKFRETGPPFEVVLFSPSDRLEFWLNGSRPKSLKSVPKGEEIGARDVLLNPEDKKRFDDEF